MPPVVDKELNLTPNVKVKLMAEDGGDKPAADAYKADDPDTMLFTVIKPECDYTDVISKLAGSPRATRPGKVGTPPRRGSCDNLKQMSRNLERHRNEGGESKEVAPVRSGDRGSVMESGNKQLVGAGVRGVAQPQQQTVVGGDADNGASMSGGDGEGGASMRTTAGESGASMRSTGGSGASLGSTGGTGGSQKRKKKKPQQTNAQVLNGYSITESSVNENDSPGSNGEPGRLLLKLKIDNDVNGNVSLEKKEPRYNVDTEDDGYIGGSVKVAENGDGGSGREVLDQAASAYIRLERIDEVGAVVENGSDITPQKESPPKKRRKTPSPPKVGGSKVVDLNLKVKQMYQRLISRRSSTSPASPGTSTTTSDA